MRITRIERPKVHHLLAIDVTHPDVLTFPDGETDRFTCWYNAHFFSLGELGEVEGFPLNFKGTTICR